MALVAKIAVEGTNITYDKLYDYHIPKPLENLVRKGCRVLVPFGSGNRKRQGFIVDIAEDTDASNIKPILELLDNEPLLSVEMLELGIWLRNRIYSCYYDVFKSMLPAGIGFKIVVEYSINKDITGEDIQQLDGVERELAELLYNSRATVRKERICKILGIDSNDEAFDRLEKQGYIIKQDNSVRKIGDATAKMVRLKHSPSELEDLSVKLTEKQRKVVDFLFETDSATVKEVCYYTAVSTNVINRLIKLSVIEAFEEQKYRIPKGPEYDDCQGNGIALTEGQEKAYQGLLAQYRSGKPSVGLLYGITGSGKTQVYMKLIEDAISDGKDVIVMVPEIALTPQIMSNFLSRFGENIAVMHSGLSLGERLDEWKRVREKEVSIVVGTRSAVFAPFENLGLIIMDEEQEHTYKSEANPRFHARDVAKYRSVKNNCLLLLASATPSVESFYLAMNKKYKLYKLTERFGNAILPEVHIVDMSEELRNGNKSIYSEYLQQEIKYNLENSKQTIILLNRRGYNTYISCRSCNSVISCPNCSISLTYHSANNRLMCHYCGFSMELISSCPVCKGEYVRFSGVGTQAAEDELKSLFPDARILRMDTDTTFSRFSHEKSFAAFKRMEYDIMIGTQMVAKGLDFGNVTLVGVLSADSALLGDDFRAGEKAFSLITQVIGRAGRGEYPGKAVIQSVSPDNRLLSFASNQDYEGFYNSEIELRKLMIYPPFCDILLLVVAGIDQNHTREGILFLSELIKDYGSKEYGNIPIRMLGPVPTSVHRVGGRYRYRLILKCKESKELKNLINKVLILFSNERKYKELSLILDFNPINIM